MQQVSYGPLILSIMLIMSCYTGFLNVRRGWQSLNMGPRLTFIYVSSAGWVGYAFIHPTQPTDALSFKPKKLSVPFLYPGVPAGLTPFRGLVPLVSRAEKPGAYSTPGTSSMRGVGNTGSVWILVSTVCISNDTLDVDRNCFSLFKYLFEICFIRNFKYS